VPWAYKWQRVTRALSRALAELSRKLTWKETAEHFGVNWKTVAAAVERAVEWGLKHRPWKPLHVIGTDDVSGRKGHRYLTPVYDLIRRRLV
jgi:transposase